MSNPNPQPKVHFEATPNPQTLRFVCNRTITDFPAEFKTVQETARSPLAKKLFGFPWTAGVYIGKDFISVSKQDWVDWETLSEPLAGLIEEHLERGEAVILEPVKPAASSGAASGAASATASDSDDVRMIKKILEEEIRPAVAQDGGDIVFHSFENGIVSIFMQGSCSGCPSSTVTLKLGIEERLKSLIPSVKEVISI